MKENRRRSSRSIYKARVAHQGQVKTLSNPTQCAVGVPRKQLRTLIRQHLCHPIGPRTGGGDYASVVIKPRRNFVDLDTIIF